MRKLESILVLLFVIPFLAFGQVTIEGYVYESGNRGYLNLAKITVVDKETKALRGESTTDLNGKFELALSPGFEFLVRVNKKPFENKEQIISTVGKNNGDKVFAKFEMERMPGYLFEVTLAPSRANDELVVDAITGAWIEVYNNTKEEEVMSAKNHPSHTFSCRFEQGNHYTILIRKDGFFNKRLEAYVNVKGCILCFDGVGEVKPGVSDVLTEGLEMGTLLANVEMQKVELNKTIEINNIYYDVGSARIKSAGRKELDDLSILLNDNAGLLVEIGSHTDSQGDDKFNQKLSLKRARGVVKYLIDKGIGKQRLIAKGYGESKLRNSCGNGVKCSERRHQKNRRTELKVVGFVNTDLADDRSLAEMKSDEALAKLMEELGSSEIKIADGAEMPEDLKKQIEAEEKARLNKSTKPIPSSKPIASTESIKQKDKIENKDEPTTMVLEQEEPILEKEIVKPPVAQPIVSSQNKPKIEVEEIAAENDQSIREDLETEESFGDTFADKEFRALDNLPKEKNQPKIIPDQDVTTLPRIRKPKSMPAQYNGYKIEIISSISELPLSHNIFSRHGNITMEETNKGTFAYLLGDFKDKKDAELFLENVLSRSYKQAQVVHFKKGRRIVK